MIELLTLKSQIVLGHKLCWETCIHFATHSFLYYLDMAQCIVTAFSLQPAVSQIEVTIPRHHCHHEDLVFINLIPNRPKKKLVAGKYLIHHEEQGITDQQLTNQGIHNGFIFNNRG